MAWTSLKETPTSKPLESLPLVLAGPILRKVTSDSVTVWVVLQKAATVKLGIFGRDGRALFKGSRDTTAIGANLHMVAVTAKAKVGEEKLTEGQIFQYQLTFDIKGGAPNVSLATATRDAPLAYTPYNHPTFCVPPKELNNLRLFQGSCRMPHAHGSDAMGMLDYLIGQAVDAPLRRPHQLLLTGDQIYADDVAASMLVMLMDASEALLGPDWDELLIPLQFALPASKLAPLVRGDVLKKLTGFTTADPECHLMSLGEFLCMYLFAWSDVLWPKRGLELKPELELPSFEEVAKQVIARSDITIQDPDILSLLKNIGVITPGRGFRPGPKAWSRSQIEEDIGDLNTFRETLPNVRRALANIPTYMMFDDHEVTDDWNMTGDIYEGVYGSVVGIAIVRNALVAYALCQHWGNAPDQFEAAGTVGFTLLTLLDKKTASAYHANDSAIRRCVGVEYLKGASAVPLPAKSLTWHYTIEGTGHQVIVTDTRSRRTFPDGNSDPPHLLSADGLKKQIEDAPLPLLDGVERAQLVVLTTNAPNVQPLRVATEHPKVASMAAGKHQDLYEAWEVATPPFERLLATLSTRFPAAGTDGKAQGAAILLSGDVHFSFASRLLYVATSPFERGNRSTSGVFAQLVASSFKRQNDNTLDMDKHGYTYDKGRKGRYILGIVGGKQVPLTNEPEYYFGWTVPKGSTKPAMEITINGETYHLFNATLANPTFQHVKLKLPVFDLKFDTRLLAKPEFAYRLDYLTTTTLDLHVFAPISIRPLPRGATRADREDEAQRFKDATANYRAYHGSTKGLKQIVGTNNLAEISFEGWENVSTRKVLFTVRWKDNDPPHHDLLCTYVVSLDPKDSNFLKDLPQGFPTP